MEFPVFKTERLFLSRITEADVGDVFRGLSDPRVIGFYGVSYQTLEATREQMDWFARLEDTGTGLWWKITWAGSERFVGCLGFSSLSREHQKAEIGFWLLPEFWGKGVLAEAMPPVVEYAFTGLGIHRIEAFVESENQKSKRAAEKLGFEFEGRMRDCEIKDGRFISLDIYSIVNHAL